MHLKEKETSSVNSLQTASSLYLLWVCPEHPYNAAKQWFSNPVAIQSPGEVGKNVDTKTPLRYWTKAASGSETQESALKKKNWPLPMIPTWPKFEDHISRKKDGRKKWARDGEKAVGEESIRKSCFFRAQFPKVALFNTF